MQAFYLCMILSAACCLIALITSSAATDEGDHDSLKDTNIGTVVLLIIGFAIFIGGLFAFTKVGKTLEEETKASKVMIAKKK